MKVAFTTVSSKGQIVIPSEMRKGIKKGEKLLIIEHKNYFIIKRLKDLEKSLLEEFKFAEKTFRDLKTSKDIKYLQNT